MLSSARLSAAFQARPPRTGTISTPCSTHHLCSVGGISPCALVLVPFACSIELSSHPIDVHWPKTQHVWYSDNITLPQLNRSRKRAATVQLAYASKTNDELALSAPDAPRIARVATSGSYLGPLQERIQALVGGRQLCAIP